MSEYEMKINGQEFIPSPDNTVLYTFAGKLCMYNHVYLMLEQGGAYIFQQSENGRAYGALGQLAVDNDFPMILNQREVAECDQRAFAQLAFKDLSGFDHVPEDWQ